MDKQHIIRERALRRADRLANLLDTRFAIPGTGFRFGLDPLVSLLPIAGDTVMLLVGLYPVFEAIRLRLGAGVVLRMLLNLGIDWLVGLVPLIGFIPDSMYKANSRNAKLLRNALERRIGRGVPGSV
ncbi:MAG: DUF4112 domain-containing protein [Phycisphaerales bacterium JB065]